MVSSRDAGTMSWETATVSALEASEIDVVAYLPDSILDGLIDQVIDSPTFETIRVSREEEAVSMLSGVWLGGGRGALICQSSGLANCFNALGSHAKPSRLPFLGLVTRRGDLDEYNLAQVPAGYGLPKMLDGIGIRYHHVDTDDRLSDRVAMAANTAFATQEPYILLYERLVTGGKDD